MLYNGPDMHTEDIDVVCGHEGAPHIAKVILVCLFSRLDAEIKYIVLLICGSIPKAKHNDCRSKGRHVVCLRICLLYTSDAADE